MTMLRAITTTTPDGEFHIIIDESDVAPASGFGDIHELATRLPDDLRDISIQQIYNHPYKAQVTAYYRGDPTALAKIARDQTGTEFQQRVWHVIDDIPYGTTLSYKELARQSGNPAAIRAAGTICSLNRLILLIPCHRVLKSDGSIGSYLYGTPIKTSLLVREGALPSNTRAASSLDP